MGRRSKHRFRNKNSKPKKNHERSGDFNHPTAKHSKKKPFLAFYNHILRKSFKDTQEAEKFNLYFRKCLPMAIRLNRAAANHQMVEEKLLKTEVACRPGIEELVSKNKFLDPEWFKLKRVEWFPNKCVYTMTATRNLVKKAKAAKPLQRYIQSGNEMGLLTRQELVSMLPPLYMNIQPGDKVLDMCAAPGSKTSQLLENLLLAANVNKIESSDLKGSGFYFVI